MDRKLKADEILVGKSYLINGRKETIIKIIPVQEKNKIIDVEFLYNKIRKLRFSYEMYLNGSSHVETIEEVNNGRR